MHPTVYRDLMRAYLENRMSADEFEELYIPAFRAEKGGVWVEPLYWILQGIFTSVDAYCKDCTPEEEDHFNITEPTFRKEITEALEKLDKFLQEYEGNYYLTETEAANLQPAEFARL
jgi:Bacterial self-protective colicin-like immunity